MTSQINVLHQKIVSSSGFFLAANLINAGSAFIILPYLSRIFDIHRYGELALILAILQISTSVSDFAFGLTSAHRMSTASPPEADEFFKVITVARVVTTTAAIAVALAAAMVTISRSDVKIEYINLFMIDTQMLIKFL